MADPHLCYEGHNIGVDRRFSVNIIVPKIAAPHLCHEGYDIGVDRRFSSGAAIFA